MIRTYSKTNGAIAGIGAYLAWGFISLYFQLLTSHGVNARLLLANRVVWSVAFCVLLLILMRGLDEAKAVIKSRRLLGALAITSVLIAINWYAFIYSIETQQLNQSALGYFINPLVSIMLGLIVLRESLRPVQWVSVLLAASGVGVIVIARGQLPWIGLSVAISFGLYGLMRKMTPVSPIVGLTIETIILSPLALAYMIYVGNTHPVTLTTTTHILLALSGAITAIPLLFFAYAARALRLGTIGFLQYIAPTCQLLVAIFIGHEKLSRLEQIGFVPIWIALIIFSAEAAWFSTHAIKPTEEATEPV